MADIVIRDVPDETLAELDAAAARAGVSRVEYLRRTLAAEANRVAGGVRPPLTRDDWRQPHALTAALADEDVMRGGMVVTEAWLIDKSALVRLPAHPDQPATVPTMVACSAAPRCHE